MLKGVGLLGLLFFMLCLPAVAQTGQAVAVNIDARATLAGATRVLRAGSDLSIGETVVTDDNGQVQVLFSDSTKLVIGPNSSLVLEDYLLRGDGSVGKLAVNALSGTFRFVTGNAPKDQYAITTPSGTIGVRGTAFDFFIFRGITYLIMYHGTTNLCSAGSCVEVNEICQIGAAGGGTASLVGLSTRLSAAERETFRAGFRYAGNQSTLENAFRIIEAPECQLAGPQRIVRADIDGVLDTCAPIIAEQYAGTRVRWGQCTAAVSSFLGGLDPNAPDTAQIVADLVVRLAELFLPTDDCDLNPTELPDAIALAGNYAGDAVQRDAILEIAQTIEDCLIITTAAIGSDSASPN